MGKDEEIQNKIVTYLQHHTQGSPALQIAQNIGHNRITVGKYLDILKANNVVVCRTVGQANLWSLAPKQTKPKILIVDDEIPVVNLIALTLGTQHYDLLKAYDGEQALQLTAEHMPDLIILDIMMPKKDGLTVCKMLKENVLTKNIYVILLSAKSQTQDKIKGHHAGADYYMTKPFDPQELEALVQVKSTKHTTDPITNLPLTTLQQLQNSAIPSTQTHACTITINQFTEYTSKCGFKDSASFLKLFTKLLLNIIDTDEQPPDKLVQLTDGSFGIVSARPTQNLQSTIEASFANAKPFLTAVHQEEDCTKKLTVTVQHHTLQSDVLRSQHVQPQTVQ